MSGTSRADQFSQSVVATIRKYGLIQPGEHIIVAVSGGADSIALLTVLHELQARWNLRLTAAHLDHGIRGAAARQEALFVRGAAERLGIACIDSAQDVPGYAAARGLSLQEAAREVRYGFFRQVLAQTGAHKVALGHHADDQAETVLLWLMRGTSLAGLGGMPPSREGVYIRPLLEVTRDEIEQYLHARRIDFVPGTSGFEMQYLRNRVRHQLIPLLTREYNPQIRRALVRMAELARQDEAGLIELVEDELSKHLVPAGDGFICRVAVFTQRNHILQRRLLRTAIGRLKGNMHGLTMAHIDLACSLLDGQGSSRVVHLPGGCAVRREYDRLVFSKGAGNKAAFFYSFDELPDSVSLPEIDKRLVLQMRAAEPETIRQTQIDPNSACIDYAKISWPLVVRTWQAGDRFYPLGLGGSKKLHKFFIDCKIPSRLRRRIPIMLFGGRIAWVCGLRLDDRFKTSADTKKVLMVSMA
jgi:tRNA(Ile)-lysidine synthase